MLKSIIISQLSQELNTAVISHDTNSSKKIKALNALISRSNQYLRNGVDYSIRTTLPNGLGNLNQGDLVEYLIIEFLGLDSTKKTPSSQGVDILDKRYKYNEIKSCFNPSNVGFITDFSKNYIVATDAHLMYCKGSDLLRNISLTSCTKNGYRVKKAWCLASASRVKTW